MVPADGWAASDRHDRLPPGWDAIRRRVLRRARFRCEALLPSGVRCPAKATDCDHVIPGDDHSDSNLQALCGDHHSAKTRAEAREAYERMRAKLKHPSSNLKHPGLL